MSNRFRSRINVTDLVTLLDINDLLLGCRIDGFKGLARGSLLPLIVDENL